jgi:hypothetical protein
VARSREHSLQTGLVDEAQHLQNYTSQPITTTTTAFDEIKRFTWYKNGYIDDY